MSDPQPAPVAPATPAAAPAAPEAPVTPAAPAAPSTPAAPASVWHEKWRDDLADGDDAFRKQLDRVSSPVQFGKNHRALEAELGRIKNDINKPKTLAADATPEQVSEYRKANGIPETHDKYEYKLPDGFNFGEADKPYVDSYLKEMHSKHAPTAAVEAGLHAYAKILEQQAVEYVQRDKNDQRDFEESMRSEWGNDFRPNMNLVGNFISSAPPEIAQMIQHGRGPDGKALLNSPNFVRWVNNLARELNPAATVVNGESGVSSLDTINAELQKFSEMRRTQGLDAWHKNETGRARERVLLSAKEKLEKRKAG